MSWPWTQDKLEAECDRLHALNQRQFRVLEEIGKLVEKWDSRPGISTVERVKVVCQMVETATADLARAQEERDFARGMAKTSEAAQLCQRDLRRQCLRDLHEIAVSASEFGEPSAKGVVEEVKILCKRLRSAETALEEERKRERDAWNPSGWYARKLHDLLARIHRDGGYYTGKVGLHQSLKDADERVARLNALADAAKGCDAPLPAQD